MLLVGSAGQRANIDFQVAEVSDNILSLGTLLRNGFSISSVWNEQFCDASSKRPDDDDSIVSDQEQFENSSKACDTSRETGGREGRSRC